MVMKRIGAVVTQSEEAASCPGCGGPGPIIWIGGVGRCDTCRRREADCCGGDGPSFDPASFGN